MKRDFQLLMKRIRFKFSDDKIRFFMSGEYGSQTFRPHYHAILFGLHLDDLKPYKTVKEAGEYYTYYNSESLQECWPYGYVVVGEVTWESCAYTARYVMKKLKGKEAKFYEEHNIQPEFTLMSRKPGIARRYYDEHPDIYEQDKINVSTPKGGKSFRPLDISINFSMSIVLKIRRAESPSRCWHRKRKPPSLLIRPLILMS